MLLLLEAAKAKARQAEGAKAKAKARASEDAAVDAESSWFRRLRSPERGVVVGDLRAPRGAPPKLNRMSSWVENFRNMAIRCGSLVKIPSAWCRCCGI